MTDRELLKLAAKAAWLDLADFQDPEAKSGLWLARGYSNPSNGSRDWNPLEDDGDALRLAVTLGFIVVIHEEMKTAGIHHSGKLGKYDAAEDFAGDRFAATRRAIVRAAAELVREKKND